MGVRGYDHEMTDESSIFPGQGAKVPRRGPAAPLPPLAPPPVYPSLN